MSIKAGEVHTSRTLIEWDDIFSNLSPLMINEASEADLTAAMNKLALDFSYDKLKEADQFKKLNLMSFKVDSDDFQTVKIQLRALGLITKSTKSRSVKDTGTYWTLTPYGDNVMTRLRAIQKPQT